jgi:uncharacterized damage-inducible protein DinB
MGAPGDGLVEALLESWDRNNTILINLLHAIPERAMDASAAEGSPTVAAVFMHVHYVRLVLVMENAPEAAAPLPAAEWQSEGDRARVAQMLTESAIIVRHAVMERMSAGRAMDRHYDHPILLLQHLIWHEGYHHGQIKIALKSAGHALDDHAAGRLTWRVWMNKTAQAALSTIKGSARVARRAGR